MINNRQNGRRRGRGGGPRSPNNTPNTGNRQDNRSRGNAAQLLEKYKAMARDMQMQGDRVQAETYLQYADHYFRVLGENRPRFEEQRPSRDDFSQDEDDDQNEIENIASSDDRDERPAQNQRDQGQRDQGQHDQGQHDQGQREERPRQDYRAEREPRGNGEDRPRRPRPRPEISDDNEQPSEERISLDVLPPAIAIDNDETPSAPRRRVRRPANEGPDADIAPAA